MQLYFFTVFIALGSLHLGFLLPFFLFLILFRYYFIMRCRYRQLDIEFLRQKQSTGNKRADFVGYMFTESFTASV